MSQQKSAIEALLEKLKRLHMANRHVDQQTLTLNQWLYQTFENAQSQMLDFF